MKLKRICPRSKLNQNEAEGSVRYLLLLPKASKLGLAVCQLDAKVVDTFLGAFVLVTLPTKSPQQFLTKGKKRGIRW